MWEKTAIDVYRPLPTTDNLSDPVYEKVGTVYGRVQPFTADQALHNNQQFSNVRDYISFDGQPDVDVFFGDELVYNNEYRRVQYVERFRLVLPHAEVLVSDSQWVRV